MVTCFETDLAGCRNGRAASRLTMHARSGLARSIWGEIPTIVSKCKVWRMGSWNALSVARISNRRNEGLGFTMIHFDTRIRYTRYLWYRNIPNFPDSIFDLIFDRISYVRYSIGLPDCKNKNVLNKIKRAKKKISPKIGPYCRFATHCIRHNKHTPKCWSIPKVLRSIARNINLEIISTRCVQQHGGREHEARRRIVHK